MTLISGEFHMTNVNSRRTHTYTYPSDRVLSGCRRQSVGNIKCVAPLRCNVDGGKHDLLPKLRVTAAAAAAAVATAA